MALGSRDLMMLAPVPKPRHCKHPVKAEGQSRYPQRHAGAAQHGWKGANVDVRHRQKQQEIARKKQRQEQEREGGGQTKRGRRRGGQHAET